MGTQTNATFKPEIAMTVRKLLEAKGDFVSTAPPTATVRDIIDQLERDEVAAVVVSPDGKRIDGIISNASIVRGLRQFGPEVVDLPVVRLMRRPVVVCDIGEPMRTVYELMDRHKIRHVPIVDENGLCGIIHMLDVVKYRLVELDMEAEALKEYVAGRT